MMVVNRNFTMHGPGGHNFDIRIVFVEIIQPQLTRYKYGCFPYFNVTVTFEQQVNKTMLSMLMLFETKEELQKSIEVYKADEGLKQTISRLDANLKS